MNPAYPILAVLGLFGSNVLFLTDTVNHAKEVNESISIPFLEPKNTTNNTTAICTNSLTENNNTAVKYMGHTICNINGMSHDLDLFLTYFGIDTVSFLFTIIIVLLIHITLQKLVLNMIGGAIGWAVIFIVVLFSMRAMVG